MNVAYVLLLACFLRACEGASQLDIIPTSSGVYKGFTDDGVTKWLGMRFAKAPVGDLRWRPPVAMLANTKEVLVADKFGAACLQQKSEQSSYIPEQSEDCLFINVYSPKNYSKGNKYPVMVFMYGGSFVSGAGSIPVYDGSPLSKEHDVVIVTFNYRLGAFGFSALDAFGQGQGSYGILDQVYALKWVHSSIASFGGHKENVTIFGESAGAISVCAHLVSPLSANLFKTAIMESGFCKANPLHEEQKQSSKMASDLGCMPDDAACLRKADAKHIQEVTKHNDYGLSVDHYLLDASPIDLLEQGKANKNIISVLMGSNTNETTTYAFVTEKQRNLSNKKLNQLLLAQFHSQSLVERIEQLYFVNDPWPKFNVSAAALAYEHIYTDIVFGCPTRRAAEALVSKNGVAVYHYVYGHVPTCTYAYIPKELYELFGAFHASELPYVFNTPANEHCSIDHDGKVISAAMGQFWTQLARYGTPNHDQVPYWNPYSTNAQESVYFAKGNVQIIRHYREKYCNFWESAIP